MQKRKTSPPVYFKRINSFLSIILLVGLILTGLVYAQESLINRILGALPSLVSVSAVKISLIPENRKKAGINQSTGEIVTVKKTRKAQFARNGAGVILQENGLIITNLHIVHGANYVFVKLHDGKRFKAKILDLDRRYDLALLKIEPPFALQPLPFADSNKIKLGEEVINVGHSTLLKETLSAGNIIGLGTRTLPTSGQKIVELIKANINLHKGDSGGPLLNRDGRLIGMVVARLRKKDRASFAVPSNKIKNLYLEYLK